MNDVMTEDFLSPTWFEMKDWERIGTEGIDAFNQMAVFEHLFFAIKLGMIASEYKADGDEPPIDLLDTLEKKGKLLKRFAEVLEDETTSDC